MKQDEIRTKLIDGTIYVIARYGLDKATTKQIALETNTNEAYIYRCFVDKEDLFAKTFSKLDEELVTKTTQYISVMYINELKFEMRCWIFYTAIWRFLLSNKAKCLAFIRYYYSPYFAKHSADEHKKRFAPLVKTFSAAFRDEANVWMIMNHILNVLFDFAVKVYNNAVPDNDDTTEHVFRLIYVSVEQYFKTKEC